MADISPETFKTGDVLTIEASVRWAHTGSDGEVAVGVGKGRTFYVPRDAIIAVRPVISPDDLVEHTANGREGVVRHVHESLAWVEWTGNVCNTVTPVSDLRRLRTAAEMAALAEPDPDLVAPMVAAEPLPEPGLGPSAADESALG